MEEAPEPVEQNDLVVTVSITRLVRPGRKSDVERWLGGIMEALTARSVMRRGSGFW
jgi:hypothetical protein